MNGDIQLPALSYMGPLPCAQLDRLLQGTTDEALLALAGTIRVPRSEAPAIRGPAPLAARTQAAAALTTVRRGDAVATPSAPAMRLGIAANAISASDRKTCCVIM